MNSFTGYVIREEKDSDKKKEDSDFESDSDDDGFEDADQDFDFIHKPSRKLRNVTEKMKEMEWKNGRFVTKPGTTRVRGRFDRLFSHPWWMVEFKINASRSSKNDKLVSSLPSYSLRTGDDVGESLLSLFLTRGCKVNDQHVAMLLEFIRGRNLRPTLKDLIDNVKEFAESSKEGHDIAGQIQTALHNSPSGKAFTVPLFTKFAHQLFPRHVCSIFDECSQEELECLNEALENESWVFGYWTVLKNRFGLSGCEAKLKSFKDCNLLDDMPVVMQEALYIYDALSELIRRNGHTYVLFKQLKEKLKTVKNWTESLDYLREISVVGISEDHLGNSCHVFLTHIRRYEATIAGHITEIMDKKPWTRNVEIDEQVFGGDPDQVQAAKLITEKSVVVMSGRGGCGKTFVVSKVLKKALEDKKENIKDILIDLESANVDTPEEGSEVSTLNPSCTPIVQTTKDSEQDGQTMKEDPHNDSAMRETDSVSKVDKRLSCEIEEKQNEVDDEVLLTAPTGKAASILGKRIGIPSHTLHSVIFSCLHWESKDDTEWKFSKVRLLVCDECSLVSVRVFSKLISILREHAQLQQLILLGDVNQLPSIEPGNFLNDVFHTLMTHGLSITLRTNHRSESDLIVQNAAKISKQQRPWFDPQRGFFPVEYQSEDNDGDSESSKITQVVKGVLQNEGNPFILPTPKVSQFVAFRRNDCNNINEQCALHYNNHPIKDCHGKVNFEVGDKVCVTRNVACLDEYKDEEVKLCNGEIFFIANIIEEKDERNKKKIFYCLDNGDKIMKIDFRTLKSAKLSHAWARTIHTFQGSESDTVVYVVGRQSRYQNWQHVYTAVTRGVKQVIIVHNPSSLSHAVTRLPVKRQTKLKEDIVQALRNERRRRPDVYHGLKTNTQIPSHSGVGHNNAFASLPVDAMEVTHAFPVSEFDDEDQEWVLKESALESEPHLREATSSNDFSISRKNLQIKKHQQEQEDQRHLLPASSANGTSYVQEVSLNASEVGDLQSPDHTREHLESPTLLSPLKGHSALKANGAQSPDHTREHLENPTLLSPLKGHSALKANCARSPDDTREHLESPTHLLSPLRGHSALEVSGAQSPGDKRKHPENTVLREQGALEVKGLEIPTHKRKFPESTIPLSPPQTPPHFREFPSSLSSVSPLRQTSRETQQVHDRIPTRNAVTARYDGRCKVCQDPIRKGIDQITVRKGSNKSWIHEHCSTSGQQ